MNEVIAADIEAIRRIDAVPAILDVACRVTGLRFAAIARVTETSWTCCAVRDDIDFGLKPGGQLELSTTICDEIRSSGEAVIINHVDEDEAFRNHATPRIYGFQSYISMPIILADGSFFGTLCALDPEPAALATPEIVSTFKLFAELIAMHLESQSRLALSEAALLDAQQTAELREQFIAVLGHDLRNPLAAIEAGTTVMADTPLTPRASQVLGMIESSCRRMAGLINDVLDFTRSRLGGGLVSAHRTEEDLYPTAGSCDRRDPRGLSRTNHRRTARSARAGFCDAPRIAQLASNLLANAISHGDGDSPIRIEAQSANGLFRLTVANRGRAIAPETLSRLFQPFVRASDGRTQGLGLGLYIVSEIARAHGGAMTVTSDAETVFTLTMPDREAKGA